MIGEPWALLLDYFRLVSYGIVLLTSIFSFRQKKVSSLLLVGDIVLALLLIFTSLVSFYAYSLGDLARDLVWTPVIFLWAILHLWILVKKT